jgi:hypothetical protein
MTHHDIYDWDANAPPTLIDVTKDGTKIPALAQSTTQGLLFVLNRLTGEPIFGAEERPVPPLDALGDQTWPTQPFPLKPPPISRTSMTREEVNKTSRESEKACKALYDTMVQSGPYTPYGMVPSLVFPSSEGGGSWSGASYDPTRHLIVVNTRSLGTAGELRPSMSSGLLPSFGKVKIPFDDPDGYPCSAPPWASCWPSTPTPPTRLARAARGVQGADRARDSEDRHAERRRSDRDRQRADLHRQHDRSAVPRLRFGDWQGVVGGDAAQRRHRHAFDDCGQP